MSGRGGRGNGMDRSAGALGAFARFLKARAENIGVVLLTLMFFAFMLQIGSRYVFSAPLTWTLEACLTLWLWTVFWGAAFTLDEPDHVRFDVLYQSVPRPVQRLFALVSAGAIAAGFLAALPATLDYITFYQIKRSPTLLIRLDIVFSVYAIFAVAMIARYAWRCWTILRRPDPEDWSLGR